MNKTKSSSRTAAVFLAIATIAMAAGCKVTDEQVDSGFTGENASRNDQATAPVIWGDPETSVLAGTQYLFQPEAADEDGDVLKFAIVNKPAWATFDQYSGLLQGVPGPQHVGRTREIVISVTDENSVVSLASFDLTVEGTGAPSTDDDVSSDNGGDDEFVDDDEDMDEDEGSSDDGSHNGGADDNGGASDDGADDEGTDAGSNDGGDDNNGGDADGGSDDGPAVNQPPSLTGIPNTSAVVGSQYSFKPDASDPEGDSLSFSIVNKPAWANFNPGSGRLVGTPDSADVGTTSSIEISATDGSNVVAMSRFSITVEPVGTVSYTLQWVAPSKNEDGSALVDLAGYRIYYGTSPGDYSETIEIHSAGVTSYVIEDLAPGTYYLAMTSVNAKDMESKRTAEVALDL